MPMFRLSQMTKWIGVVTMSALLLWATSGIQVVSQQIQMPTRSQIVQGLGARVATLTASEGDILDVENAVFYSDPGVFALAYVPLHPSSRSLQLFPQLIEGDIEEISFGVLYLEGDWPDPDLLLRAGVYTLKLKGDRSILAVAEDGETEIFCGCWQPIPAPVFQTPVPPVTQFSFSYQPQQQALGIPMLDSINLLTAAAVLTAVATLGLLVMAIISYVRPPQCGGG
jgi:hypothetical protein